MSHAADGAMRYDVRHLTMLATALAPHWLRSPECMRVLAALDRGELLLIPSRIASGLAAQTFATIATQVGSGVVVSDAFDVLTTRERVEA